MTLLIIPSRCPRESALSFARMLGFKSLTTSIKRNQAVAHYNRLRDIDSGERDGRDFVNAKSSCSVKHIDLRGDDEPVWLIGSNS